MKKGFKIIGVLLFIALAIFIIVRNFLLIPEESPKEVTYTEFLQLVNEKQVSEIEWDESSNSVKAILLDKSKVTTKVINQDIFLEYIQKQLLTENTIEIKLAPEKLNLFLVLFYMIVGLYMFGILIYGLKFVFKSIFKNIFKNAKKEDKNSSSFFTSFVNKLDTEINYIEKLVKSNITFLDVAALDEEKRELEEIVDFMKNPEKYTKLGAKIPKGVLLSGSSGTGKTLLAKAVAGEAGVAYLAVSGSEFVEKYVGVGAQRVRDLFKEARKQAPCIIFIDEIDSIGANRNDSNSERRQTLEQLLIELDGFKDRTDIVILAATNRPDSLDPALVRPGRFDRKITVNLPDVKGRVEILRVHARNKKFLDDVDFYKIACDTAGYSGAELENLLNESALTAARNNHDVIHKSDIEEALKKILVGLQKTGRIISDKERKITAVHEAGHAIVSKLLPTQSPVKEISIVPRGVAGGYTLNETIEDKQYMTKKELKERLIVLLAGRAAENVFLGDISTGASNDLDIATANVRKMIMLYGMDNDLGPVSYSEEKYFNGEILTSIWEKIAIELKYAEAEANKLINENREMMEEFISLLLEKETVMGDELENLFKRFKSKTLVDNIK